MLSVAILTLAVIPYGIDEMEQAELLRRMAEEVEPGDAVTIDEIYYGALEMQQSGITPVVRLKGLLRLMDWVQALAAYDEALQFRRPDTAPLAYAMTQGNLLSLFSAMADLPGEDRRGWLLKALRAGWEAYTGFERSQHAPYQEQATRLLRDLRTSCGDAFAEMWAAAGRTTGLAAAG